MGDTGPGTGAGGGRQVDEPGRLRLVAAWIFLAAAALAGVAATVRSVSDWWVAHHGLQERPFSRDAWAGSGETGRGRMVRDLIRSGRLVGLSAEEVLDFLGPPDERGVERVGGDVRFDYDIGTMGLERLWGGTPRYRLRVLFGRDGRVRRVLVVPVRPSRRGTAAGS